MIYGGMILHLNVAKNKLGFGGICIFTWSIFFPLDVYFGMNKNHNGTNIFCGFMHVDH
jgi:hypothetical protein